MVPVPPEGQDEGDEKSIENPKCCKGLPTISPEAASSESCRGKTKPSHKLQGEVKKSSERADPEKKRTERVSPATTEEKIPTRRKSEEKS